MSRKADTNPYRRILEDAGVSMDELATVIDRPAAEVEEWMAAKQVPEDAAVLLRILNSKVDLLRRVNRERRKQTRNLQSDQERRDEQVGRIYSGGYRGQSVTVPK